MALSVLRRLGLLGVNAGRLLAAGPLFLVLVACDTPSSAPISATAVFTESDSAYDIRGLIAQLDMDDERALFGSVASVVENADGGYVAIDALNQRLVFMDRELNPVRTVGRQGEGPGEYQLPWVLIRNGDEIAVLDQSYGRVTYLSARGDFVRMRQLGGFINDMAIHPELGLLVASMEFSDHYLGRVTESGQTPVADMPVGFRDESAVFQLPSDLVEATPDGKIHVFDNKHLALASYDGVGNLVGVAYLPEPTRTLLLERDAETVEALGGTSRVLGSQFAQELHALEDGRLFLRITYQDAMAFVLDPNSLQATPILIPEDRRWDWIRRSIVGFFDGKRLVLEGLDDGPAALAIVETELRAR